MIFIATGFLFALVSTKDEHHDRVVEIFKTFKDARLPDVLLTTNHVISETVTLTRNVYDADGRAGPPDQETVKLTLQPGGGDELRYDVLRRVSLLPGRYQVRYRVLSVDGHVVEDSFFFTLKANSQTP